MGDIEPPSKEHMETLKKAVHAVSAVWIVRLAADESDI